MVGNSQQQVGSVLDVETVILNGPLGCCCAPRPHPPITPRFPDFTMSPSGLQYKDYKEGAGEAAGPGDTCVVDWGGYTIGGWYGVGSP